MSEYSKHVLSRWTVRRQVKRAVQNHFNPNLPKGGSSKDLPFLKTL